MNTEHGINQLLKENKSEIVKILLISHNEKVVFLEILSKAPSKKIV